MEESNRCECDSPVVSEYMSHKYCSLCDKFLKEKIGIFVMESGTAPRRAEDFDFGILKDMGVSAKQAAESMQKFRMVMIKAKTDTHTFLRYFGKPPLLYGTWDYYAGQRIKKRLLIKKLRKINHTNQRKFSHLISL